MPMFLHEARLKRQSIFDSLFRNLTRLAALGVLALLAAIIGSLVIGSMPSIHAFGFGFLTSPEWNPADDKFGAFAAIIGTLITSGIALIIAIPVSFGIALFLTELSPRVLRRPLGVAIELLAGIPSIIYGMWGLFVFAPLFAKHIEPWLNDHIGVLPYVGPFFTGPSRGLSVLAAGIILAIMVIPFIASVMRDVFDVVPTMLKESAYGLGSTTWEVMLSIVLPYTKVGVAGGIMLGLGRALGETMAVTFVIGNSHRLSQSLLYPGSSISSTLANEFTEAFGELYTASLVELGLILFFITFVVLSLARYMLYKLGQREGKAA